MEGSMPVLFGMILGSLLTVAGVFLYDSASGRAPNGLAPTAAGGHPPMVNWDVVGDNWQGVQTSLRSLGGDIERGWKRLTS
jgi:hypothetical protein